MSYDWKTIWNGELGLWQSREEFMESRTVKSRKPVYFKDTSTRIQNMCDLVCTRWGQDCLKDAVILVGQYEMVAIRDSRETDNRFYQEKPGVDTQLRYIYCNHNLLIVAVPVPHMLTFGFTNSTPGGLYYDLETEY